MRNTKSNLTEKKVIIKKQQGNIKNLKLKDFNDDLTLLQNIYFYISLSCFC